MSNKQNDIFNEHQAEIKAEAKHTPTPNEIINDISGIAFKWPKETREMVFRAVNSHEAMLNAIRLARKLAQADYDHAIESKASKIVTDAAFEALRTFNEAIAQAERKGEAR